MQVIVRRGRNRVERKTEHSKASTSVMFCGNAAGELLPPMMVCKAKFVYHGWVNGGPKGSALACTDSGWFDGRTFKKRFNEVFVPNLKVDGPFAIIGDNLGSHFSEEVINICLKRNIVLSRWCQIPRTCANHWTWQFLEQWKEVGGAIWMSGVKRVVQKVHSQSNISRCFWGAF